MASRRSKRWVTHFSQQQAFWRLIQTLSAQQSDVRSRSPSLLPAYVGAGKFAPRICGPVMAGIVGRERYQFDIWGDTVNVAARLTSAASPQSVALTEAQAEGLKGVTLIPRGAVELKGKGFVALVEIPSSVAEIGILKS